MYEKLIKVSRNNDHTTGNLLGYFLSSKNYIFIGIDLSRQTNMTIPQQIGSTGI